MVSAPASVLPASAAYDMFTRSRLEFVRFALARFAVVKLDPDKSIPLKSLFDRLTPGPKI